MSHPQQRQFCRQVRKKYPNHFRCAKVADVGSLDINGNNRTLCRKCYYTGIDVFPGRNVDMVGPAHEMLPKACATLTVAVNEHYRRRTDGAVLFDTIISTEALEHDKYLPETLQAMYDNLRPGGLLLITAAGDGRAEHGTTEFRPQDSPGTVDYYRNVSNELFAQVLRPDMFEVYHLAQDKGNYDLQFYGIKRNQ